MQDDERYEYTNDMDYRYFFRENLFDEESLCKSTQY